jgi:hypothetical protein
MNKLGLSWLVRVAWLAVLCACTTTATPDEPSMAREDLANPAKCQVCHPDQFREWAASMHAYAADDPVFRAMHARGQRETQGKLGTFCLKCHAPQAVADGVIVTGQEDLDKLPPGSKGVTCFFCHSVDAVAETHNNGLKLATDLMLRGPLADPLHTDAHRSRYSALHDRDQLGSSTLCGSCHDVVTPLGAQLERGFLEWHGSVFNQAPGGDTCGQCHMPQSPQPKPVAVADGAPVRHPHNHLFPAVDTPLIAWPDSDVHIKAVQALLDATLQSAVCVQKNGGGARLSVILDNVAGGHGFPSAAALDRRLWLEMIAKKNGQIVYQTGVVADNAVVDTGADPDLWLMRDCGYDTTGASVHMFWQVASVVGNALPVQLTFNPSDPRFYQSHVRAEFPANGSNVAVMPDEVTVRVRLQPVAREVLDELLATGDLPQTVRDAMPTWQVGKTLTWTPATATHAFQHDGLATSCRTETNLNPQADAVPAVRLLGCKQP